MDHPRTDLYDVLAARCPTRQVMYRIGDKWTLLVLYALTPRAYRYRELQRTVQGISQRMLTQTLRQLERDGLVLRCVVPATPPEVTYSLTPLGCSLAEVISGIRTWAYDNMDSIQAARTAYDERQPG